MEINWKQLVEQEALLRGYSKKTIENYIFQIGRFLKSGKQAREYLLLLINQGKSNETIRLTNFAIKFYYSVINSTDENLDLILKNLPNSKRAKTLPNILSKEEIQRMIEVTKNINHRLIIQLGYSAGLRVSEIINLSWENIDFDRNMVHIKQAKGKKDRVVMLSTKVKEALASFTAEKMGLLFITTRGTKYTQRTIQKILENAAKKAKINKHVTPHTLRHSFATHLLEQGTDIRYIKDLLGHSDIRTTMIYTKVSNKDISKIKSPLD
ncbi:integrase [Candidatus Woesearchaeota archaeon CG10_big_fil_rev_8_21_14_0_10_37_12]|nr:MAG: integrase [Candidatus Woesearchaeota archaeon CG10_big_fil_rev_8_21_14_0_10_37_12]